MNGVQLIRFESSMTSEAVKAVEEVAAARAELDAHQKKALATTRRLDQQLRQRAITAINDHGASKYAVARAAQRSRTTVYSWLNAEQSPPPQEPVMTGSVGPTPEDAKRDRFIANARALADRFDEPGMTTERIKELAAALAEKVGVQQETVLKAAAFAYKAENARREDSGGT